MNNSAEEEQNLPHRISRNHPGQRPLATRGFTLVEVMVVMAIMTVLSSVGGQLIEAREEAFETVMKADLRNLATEQAQYAVSNFTYANTAAALPFTTSEGITLELVGEAGGFTARTTHAGLPNARCAIFLGTVSSVYSPATVVGKMVCDGGGGGGGYGCGRS